MYPLEEVLLLCLLAVLAGAETITDIARFRQKKLDLLRRFRPFAQGAPAHDHLGDILASLDAEQFQRSFVAWVASLIGVPQGVVAIDGKTSRRSKGAREALHMTSAFAARQRLVLGQVKVADKANEIVAIPKLSRLELGRRRSIKDKVWSRTRPEQIFVRPWSLANEVQQRLVLGRHPSRLRHRRHRLHALAFQRHQQAYAVIPQGNRTIGMTDNFDQST